MRRPPLSLLLLAAACCSPQDATAPQTDPAQSLADVAMAPSVVASLDASAESGLPPFPAPDEFVHRVDHPFFPLPPGTRFTYAGVDEDKPMRDIIDVTTRDKTILGVKVVVVLDRVFIDGELAERTLDYFAQDRRGNVWYLGEDTKEYENGEVVSTAGSFEAGKNGAKAGIVMRARPKVGQTTRQEDAPGVAEDKSTVVSLDETVATPYRTFHHCMKTKDFTPLEPGALEVKFYCRGVGFVRARDVSGGNARQALTSVER
jgi:hypothetical protein